jgi:menaquinone-dependent protoporphyrinogen oxidase
LKKRNIETKGAFHMEGKVLVAFASKYGSTREVAEAIAAVLCEDGLAADLQSMSKVRNLAPYSAAVLGAPLYIGHWHSDVARFLAKHQETLARKPSAFFTLGPTHLDEKEWQGVRIQLDQELAKYSWFMPAANELFGGKYDPAILRFPDSLLAGLPASPLHGLLASDVRDWNAIRAWAHRLSEQLGALIT